ncbi:hypothetical protein K7432_009860 [Basidiobolus ranarum]|uniref:Uncharacterized protein n=1 Tax=Basidiobolus ranarum TaxID=34480 RepID=A0ABR2WPL7_9FUNG
MKQYRDLQTGKPILNYNDVQFGEYEPFSYISGFIHSSNLISLCISTVNTNNTLTYNQDMRSLTNDSLYAPLNSSTKLYYPRKQSLLPRPRRNSQFQFQYEEEAPEERESLNKPSYEEPMFHEKLRQTLAFFF